MGGLGSYLTMPKENFPELVFPEIYIGTPYPGYSPADIEDLITKPLEKEINTVAGVDEITSTSIQGYSTIKVTFDTDVEIEDALIKIKDAVDRARGDKDFPDDLPAEPNVFEVNASEFPIMNINLSGDFSLDELKKYGEYLEDEIENLPQISKVDIRGVQEKEVKIEVDIYQMEAREVSFGDVQGAIANSNITLSGGDILADGLRRNVRVVGEFESVDEIEKVIVKQENFDIIYLKDIAKVSFAEEDKTSYAREFKSPVVMLDVVKRGGENLLIVSEAINDLLEKAKEDKFPDNLEISVTNDQSDITRKQVSSLQNSIISGVILVVLVLLFFLGSRNALFVGIAIPMSMLMAFMVLSFLGVTLNLMVLFSLILALGMLVDNGIVVVENIYRLMDEGMKPMQAAKEGAGEVAWPIIASTATTLAAFLPLALWPGLMGEFMKWLPITLMIVLASSLFVALVINPVLTSVYMKVGDPNPNKKKLFRIAMILIGLSIPLYFIKAFLLANLMVCAALITLLNVYVLNPAAKKFQNNVMPKMEARYQRFLTYVLSGKKPRWFLVGTFGLLILSFFMMAFFPPKIEYFPINQPNYLNIFIEKPIGTDIEVTNAVTKKVEEIVTEKLKKYEEKILLEGDSIYDNYLVESVIAQVGEGTSDPNAGVTFGTTPHKARITVNFVTYENRKGVNTLDVMEEVRAWVDGIPGVSIAVDKDAAGPPAGPPINIEISGEDYDALIDEAERVKTFVNNANIGGIEELKLDIETGKPELLVEIDKEKATRFNLSTYQIASTIRTALFGAEISTYKDDEDDYPINIRFNEASRNNIDAIMNQKITFRDQSNGKISQVPISAVAKERKSSTYSSVKRKDLKRVVSVSSNVLNGYNGTEVVGNIKAALEDYELQKGHTISFTGEQEDQAKEMAFLMQALLIAVFLIFMIIVSQFNSRSIPFIIVGAVVFSLIGVLMGLVIFRMDFIVIMTMIGIISLAGVVVNNAIVLIDYTNLIINRKKAELGLEKEERLPIKDLRACLVEGGQKRLRPVLLTAITTVLGLLPLAVGMNIDFTTLFNEFDANIYFGGDNSIFWGPMSWAVIFGLTFATFLTLVIVPVMYFIRFRIVYRLKGDRR